MYRVQCTVGWDDFHLTILILYYPAITKVSWDLKIWKVAVRKMT